MMESLQILDFRLIIVEQMWLNVLKICVFRIV